MQPGVQMMPGWAPGMQMTPGGDDAAAPDAGDDRWHLYGYHINYTLYGRLIKRCTDLRLPRQAEQLHARLILTSTTADNFLASKLIAFYSEPCQISRARHVFDQIPHKNTFAYNALLIACTVHNHHAHTLDLFAFLLSRQGAHDRLDLADVKPDRFTLSCVLKSMSEVALDGPLPARMVHCYVVKCGFDWDVFAGNGLVTYYSRCGDVASARSLFNEMPERDLVSWNSMISGYSQGGFFEECKGLYKRMLDSEAVRPDAVTAVSVLQACAQSSDLITGMAVHQYLIENEVEMDLSLCNSIIGVYAKCGSLDYARQLLEEMSEKDEITYGTIISAYMVHGFVEEAMNVFRGMWNPGLSAWNAVISGSVQNNQHDRVLDLVREMQGSGFKPDAVTLSSILPAILFVSHMKGGKEVHAYAIKNNYHRNIYVVTAMVDVYAKLGYLRGAQRIFDLAHDKSVIVWTAIISAYAAHGDASSALSLFEEMLNSKINPDAITFTAVLAACAHVGLVDKAREIFSSLLPKYGIQPLSNHYACVVACLSRVGKLSEAVDFVKKMPSEPTAQVWGALLSEASEAGDVELAEFVCERLFELEPENPTNYIVMANLFSKAGRWEEAESVRERLAKRGFKKVAGSSRIETSGGFVRGIAMNERRGKFW
ncbi:pentatricopeptide repeat-containing protein At2g37310-like [Salvia splendens]|uniref:pentatricopeptide repeat-containing protein At2g37310-like n=1 Tax=Salvia splendens TaxID=180675 RepID=UPI001C265BBF|nr:pentatricopeptide repeat-containing protein At2g37310-like [Salvia splendens]